MGQTSQKQPGMSPDVGVPGVSSGNPQAAPDALQGSLTASCPEQPTCKNVCGCGSCWVWLWPKPQHGRPIARTCGPAAIVVDPYSSGRYLLYELQPRMAIICVRSSLNLGTFFLKAYDRNKEYFSATVDHQSLQQVVDEVRALPFSIVGVFGGSEPGVELADQLAEALAMPASNPTALTNARKDKAAMQERLRECGVPAADQIKSGDLTKLLGWAQQRNCWPVVAKPTGSSGSDGIFFCQSCDDIASAHAELIGKMNPNGQCNDALALQEFLKGTEYIVDTVSHAGRHLCVAIWVYTKRQGVAWAPHAIVSEGNRLLPASGEVQDRLVEYVFQVLTAVGLQNGPCHTEVILTSRGPILVEVNARLHGLQGPHLIGLATGTSKAAYAVDAIVDGGAIFEKRFLPGPNRFLYPLQKHCLQMVLISPVQGYLKASIEKSIQRLRLSSVVEVIPSVKPGDYLHQTCDLNSAAGYVLMVHKSGAQIDQDRQKIREAEESGALYPVSLAPLGKGYVSPARSPASPGAPRSPASPRLQSTEKIEETWEALDTLTLSEISKEANFTMDGLE
mmetsp:Transcript_89456/g.177843  ORF Transcript_89456/g.177843 Transcript_89456/m.177843 type:complete len:563 (-) Transcript_89456:370-2058(-)|eukprot:CAMPEP_0172684734 /NCGR_PEP_ID=MMETSP1074-20121228/19762_1 /TAXON_ID=2916 /ORGANISM="Ceratium fusus, Strain PA161109" /LENGTH=562 /DNA_ID=CAMNT_0013503793 /DNA_START=24 /DNA_END=1712 /DNA_ORIENTATION=-